MDDEYKKVRARSEEKEECVRKKECVCVHVRAREKRTNHLIPQQVLNNSELHLFPEQAAKTKLIRFWNI